MKKKNLIIIIALLLVIILVLSLILKFTPLKDKIDVPVLTSKDKLVCTKLSDNYSVNITSEFKDDTVSDVKVVIKNNFGRGPSSEIVDFYASLYGSKYSAVDKEITVKLTKDTIDYYSDSKTMKKMFSDYKTVKKYYEDDDYTCK